MHRPDLIQALYPSGVRKEESGVRSAKRVRNEELGVRNFGQRTSTRDPQPISDRQVISDSGRNQTEKTNNKTNHNTKKHRKS